MLIDRASGTLEKMERQAMRTMAAIEGVGAAQDAQSSRSGKVERAMSGSTGSMKDAEQQAGRTRRSFDEMGRSGEQSGRRLGVLERAVRSLRGEIDRLSTGGSGRTTQMSGLRSIQRDLNLAKGAVAGFLGAFGAIGTAFMQFKFPALGVGVGMLVQSITALGGAALGALPAIAALASGMNLLPSVIAAAGQGLGALKLGFAGVMQAAQAGMQAQNQWAYNQRDWQQQVTQAQHAVADAAHGVSDAMFAQGEAANSLNQAYYAHQQSLQGLTNALYDQKQAQIDLTIARRDAIRTLQDMEYAANTAVLKEARAGLNIRQAQMELQQAMMTPGTTQLQLESDRLAVMEAQAAAQQTHTEAVRNRVDYSRAAHGDQTAAPVRQVTQAQHALAQSHIQVANAQHEVVQSERGIVQAQHALADASFAVVRSQQALQQSQFSLSKLWREGNAGVANYRKQLMGLTPIQRQFVQFLVGRMGPGNRSSLIGQIQQLQESAGRGLFPQLERGVRTLQGAFPMLDRNMERSGAVMGGFGRRLIGVFFGRQGLHQTDAIMQSNNRAMGSMSDAGVHVANALRTIMYVARPTVEWLAHMVDMWAKMHDATLQTAAGQDALRQRLERFRTVLMELYRFMSNLWRLFHNINQAAWDFNQTLARGAITGVGNLANKLTPGTQGAQRLHDWFMGLLPLLRALGRLAEALFRGMGQLTSPQMNQGTARLVGGLTGLVPTIVSIVTNLQRVFGPGIISGLGALGSSLNVLTGQGGPFALWLKILTAVVKGVTWLIQHIPILTPILAAVFAANTIAKFALNMTGAIVKVMTLSRAWGSVRRNRDRAMGGMASPGATSGGGLFSRVLAGGAQAAEMSHSWGVLSMGGPGSVENPLMVRVEGGAGGFGGGGRSAFRSGSTTSTLGRDATAADNAARDVSQMSRLERTGAFLSGVPLIGRFAGKLPGALGRGAGLAGEAGAAATELGTVGKLAGGFGKFLGVAGIALTALPAVMSFISTKGNFGERASAAGASLVNNLTFGLTNLHGSPTMAQQRAQGTQRGLVRDWAHFSTDPGTGLLTPQGIQQYQGRIRQLQAQISSIRNPPQVRDPYTQLIMQAPVDQKKLTDRLANLAALQAKFNREQWVAGGAAATNWEQSFQTGLQTGKNPQTAMRQMITGLGLQLDQLNPMGRRSLQNSVVAWGAQIAQQDPKMRRPVAALNSWIKNQFDDMGKHVEIVNGQILDGSTTQWNSIYSALTDPMKKAQEQLSGTFGQIRQEAIGELETMGLTRSDAQMLLKNPASANAWMKWAQGTGPAGSGTAQSGSGVGRKAGGGRVLGSNERDVYHFGANTLGGGELVMNRHHELEANARLMRHGEPTVGAIVSSRNTPHWAFARGGRATGGYALPLPRAYMGGNWSVDQGVDINGGTSAIANQPLYAMAPGTIIQEGISGFGPNAPVLHLDSPVGGNQNIYYGHAGADTVPVGAHVQAGQQISRVGAGIVGLSTGPHLEVGFGPPFGHGDAMYAFLKQLMGGRVVGQFGSAGAAGTAGGGFRPLRLRVPRNAFRGIAGLPLTVAGRAARAYATNLQNALNAGQQQSGGGLNFAGVAGLGGTASQNEALGRRMMMAAGWPASQWPSLQALWTQESGWNANAVNPSSGAYGIPQSLGHGHPYNLGDARAQIAWGLNYIRGRYGSPSAAEAHERSYNWYASGGRMANWAGWHRDGGVFRTNGPTLFGAGEGGQRETVTITPDAQGNSTRPINIHIEKIEVHRPGDVKKIVDEELGLLADSLRGGG